MTTITLPIGNNGNALAYYLHQNNLIKSGDHIDEVEKIARPLMMKEKHLDSWRLWEDFYYTIEELGYTILD